MSKWLQAARSAKASNPDSGPSFARDNSDNSDKSPPERPIVTIGAIVTGVESLSQAVPLAVAPNLSEPEETRAWLVERAAMRECSGASRVDADTLAFDQLLWIWHAANPIEHAPGQCAGCGTAFEPPVMSLPDGAQVCDKPDHACLISYGNGRRTEAVKVLRGMGIVPPAWWEL